MSYTGGYAPVSGAILLDMRRLDDVEVDPAAMSATAGAGATWFAIAALAGRHGLETALVGPASGECSTIGGALSQGLPGDMAGVTGLHVVGADGRIYETGGFTRNVGPDTTGVFLGDCGTLGVKTRATLRLRRKSSGNADASLAFASLTDLAAGAAAVARTGLAKRCLGLDPTKSRTATKVGV